MKNMFKLFLIIALFVPSIVLADSNAIVSDNVCPVVVAKTSTVEEHVGDGFCDENNVKNALKVLGFFLIVVKVAIPIIIILMGSIDLAKAIINGEEKSYGQHIKILGIRFFLGIIVFFIPSVLDGVFSAIEEYNNIESEYHNCEVCLLKPNDCESTTADVTGD